MQKCLIAIVAIFAASAAVAASNDFATTGCAKFGQKEFSFAADAASIPADDIEWLKTSLINWVASGERFKPGETVQIGPIVLKTRLASDGTLRLLEPDMKSMPFNYVDSVTATLRLVRRQKDTVESVGTRDSVAFAPLHLPLMVSSDALNASALVLLRDTAEVPGTGWVILNANSLLPADKVEYSAMSVYEAILSRPEIAKFLALPTGYQVVVAGDKDFTISKDGAEIMPKEGSYLDRIRNAP
jgi:hypothetical protein